MLNPDLFPPTVAQGARQLTLPPLPVFPFPNFVDNAVGGHSSQGHLQDIELQDAPAVACAFDRKHIEQVFEYSLFTEAFNDQRFFSVHDSFFAVASALRCRCSIRAAGNL